MMSDLSAWGVNLQQVICPYCDWRFLWPAAQSPDRCPHCHQADLEPFDPADEQLPPPEQFQPFKLNTAEVDGLIETFTSKIFLPPADLKADALRSRLQRVYLPTWLVDVTVQATWQAEVGFDYDVVSHRERFDDGRSQWISNEVTETRIRWEPRLGWLERTYHNCPAPALEDEGWLSRQVQQAATASAQAYQPAALNEAVVRVPARTTPDAWPEVVPGLQTLAADECRQAAAAQHLRDFRWAPQYPARNWTQLLSPFFTTYYLDDEGQPQPLIIDGQSGAIDGRRYSSYRRARRYALMLLAIALVFFCLTLGLGVAAYFWSTVTAVAVIAGLITVGFGFLALVPLLLAWQFNTRQRRQSATGL